MEGAGDAATVDRSAAGRGLAIEEVTDSVTTLDPLVLAGVVGALLVVLVAGWWVLRRVRRPPGKRLESLLAAREEVAILLHPNPDPDAMAAAMGVEWLAERAGTEVTKQYPGQIRHQENRAFRTVLDLDLDRIEAASELAADDVVLVDHNTARGFTGAQMVEPIAVVDHHPGNGRGTEFTDVRPEYGATATILVQYLAAVGAVFEDEEDEDAETIPPEVATGLCYGILSDTNHLTKGCSSAEFDAAATLFPAVDEDQLDRIANPQVSAEVLHTKADAIRNNVVRGSFAVCDLGAVDVVDAIPQAADELTKLEGVTAVVVFGERDGTVHLSGRSRDDRVHMGETLRHVVSDIPMASAGGHARMGGGQLSVDHMNGIGPSEGVSKEEFVDRLFEALAGER